MDIFHSDGHLPKSQRESVVTLLLKKGDKYDLANYRPISLNNGVYKILSFCLANRIQSIIGVLISSDHAAYIRKKFIGNKY